MTRREKKEIERREGKTLTRHHRKPVSLGGDDRNENISLISAKDHQSWHQLFSNLTARDIADKINTTFLDPDYRLIVVWTKLERR